MSVNKKSRNQGVNVFTDSEKSQSSKGSNHAENNRDREKSLSKVKDDLKTVIELMGPNTPHFDLNSAAEMLADSVYSDATRFDKSIPSFRDEDDKTNTEDQPMSTECDQSVIPLDNTTVQDTDVSMMIDHPSVLSNVPVQCICPPPVLPANFVYNSECMCPQMANYIHGFTTKVEKKKSEKNNVFSSFFKNFKDKKTNTIQRSGEYYTINIQQSRKNIAPKRLIFDLVENAHTKTSDYNYYGNAIPEEVVAASDKVNPPPLLQTKDSKHIKGDDRTTKQDGITEELLPISSSNNNVFTKKKKFNQKTTYTDLNGATRVDVYYFDHGCASYFRTTDRSPVIATEDLAERTETYTTKFWAEIFGSFNIGCSFFISLVLQSMRFFLYSFFRPLTVGLIQLISDYFFKPMLTTVFNAVVQPILIFFFNVVTSLRDICDPVAEAVGNFLREIAVIIRAFRIVEVRTGRNEVPCPRRLNKKNRLMYSYKAKEGSEYFEHV